VKEDSLKLEEGGGGRRKMCGCGIGDSWLNYLEGTEGCTCNGLRKKTEKGKLASPGRGKKRNTACTGKKWRCTKKAVEGEGRGRLLGRKIQGGP